MLQRVLQGIFGNVEYVVLVFLTFFNESLKRSNVLNSVDDAFRLQVIHDGNKIQRD